MPFFLIIKPYLSIIIISSRKFDHGVLEEPEHTDYQKNINVLIIFQHFDQ